MSKETTLAEANGEKREETHTQGNTYNRRLLTLISLVVMTEKYSKDPQEVELKP